MAFEHAGGVELSAYADGELEPADRQRLERHILECSACRDEGTGSAASRGHQGQSASSEPSTALRRFAA
jgi:anti-sigma factor RsiW